MKTGVIGQIASSLANKGFSGLKLSASQGVLKAAGLEPDEETLAACTAANVRRVRGPDEVEFFPTSDDFFRLRSYQYVAREQQSQLRQGISCTHVFRNADHDAETRRQEFLQAVASAASQCGLPSLDWKDLRPVPRVFHELTTAEKVATPGKGDLAAARELSVSDSRNRLLEIKKVGVITVSQLQNAIRGSTDTNSVDETIERLEKAGLVAKEYLVVCTSTTRVVVTTSTQEALNGMLNDGNKCFCGKPLAKERVEEGVAVTDVAIRLMDHSRWMTVIVTNSLLALGVPPDDILTDATTGPAEMDVLVNMAGDLLLFELKDREFSWADSNSFSNKILRYDAAQGVVITTDVVAADAKQSIEELLSKTRLPRHAMGVAVGQVPVTYIEGLSKMEESISIVLERGMKERIVEEFEREDPVADVTVSNVIMAKLATKPHQKEHVVVAAV